jgi:hypothetical protein
MDDQWIVHTHSMNVRIMTPVALPFSSVYTPWNNTSKTYSQLCSNFAKNTFLRFSRKVANSIENSTNFSMVLISGWFDFGSVQKFESQRLMSLLWLVSLPFLNFAKNTFLIFWNFYPHSKENSMLIILVLLWASRRFVLVLNLAGEFRALVCSLTRPVAPPS